MKPPLIIELTPHHMDLRGNTLTWNRIDWSNTDAAIARALNVDHKSVSYQRWKRGAPRHKKGGAHPRGWKQLYRSPVPLPVVSRPL